MNTTTTRSPTSARSTSRTPGGSWGRISSKPAGTKGTSWVFRSIRLTLLFWYGLIFFLLLGAFGTTVYLRLSRSVFKAVDAKLEAYGHSLAAGLVEMDDGSIDLELPKNIRLL